MCVYREVLFDYYHLPEFLYISFYAAAVGGLINFGYFPTQKRMLPTNWVGCFEF